MKHFALSFLILLAAAPLQAAEPNWIWSTKDANQSAAAGDVYFRRWFNADAPSKGSIEITADNRFDLFVNGRSVGAGATWQTRTRYDITPLLVPGRNLIAVRGTNDGEDPAGLVVKASIEQKDKPAVEIVTDAEWRFTTKQWGNWARTDYDDSKWEPATVLGVYGKTAPWGAAGGVQTPQQPTLTNKPRARELGFFDFRDGDRVVLLGSAFFERMQQHNYLEAMITAGLPDRNITFRNLGWGGDNVWGDARAVFGGRTDGFKRLLSDIALCNPTVIIVCYGENEAYAGENGIDEFRRGLNKLLDSLEATGARLLLLSPRQHESLGYPLPDAKEYNESLKLYRDVISEAAETREHPFIDLYDIAAPDSAAKKSRLTQNGLHLTAEGELLVAQQLLPQLGVPVGKVQIEIDIARPSLSATGAQIFDLKSGNDEVSFSAIWRATELTSSLAFSGLQPNKTYELQLDGQSLAKKTGQQWRTAVAVDLDSARAAKLRQLIAEKNALFFNRHRPQNETYLFLFRKHEQGNNAVEIPQFDPLITEQEKEIATLKKPVAHKFELKVID
ncbi:GDSL-type esterase/lipase family protein [Anatilimnocola floriformis]|uniref:GDSL-type esterase/lipase family protein n=1 Tax=Anatilimnocola floriformis TaxID=2948575 RepID=UPI0020C42E39|nr:GDSL-type esterase/lipase family protein [Anatilimnocola floriformis]